MPRIQHISRRSRNRRDQGQATILLLGVIAVALIAAVGISVFAHAVLHRAQARNAADAVALAAAIDADAAAQLQHWYGRHNIGVEQIGDQTIARSGPSQAAAWAASEPSSTTPAPALVAIVARAEQLLDTAFVSIRWEPLAVTFAADEAVQLRLVAPELGLCEQAAPGLGDDGFRFHLC